MWCPAGGVREKITSRIQPSLNPTEVSEPLCSLTFAIVVCEGLVDKLRPLLEEGTQLKLLRVVGLDAVVRDACASVEVHAGVDVHEGGALRHVEDVRHPEFLQAHGVLGHEPGEGSKVERVEQEAKFLRALVTDAHVQRTR